MKDLTSNAPGPRLVTSAFKATRAVMQQSAKNRKASMAALQEHRTNDGQNIVSMHHKHMAGFAPENVASDETCIEYLLEAGPILRRFIDATATATPVVRSLSFGAPLGRLESPNMDIKRLVDEYHLRALKRPLGGSPCGATGGTSAASGGGSENKADVCSECRGHVIQMDGHMVCTDCGLVPPDTAKEQQMSYKDAQEMLFKANGLYKRSARWSEWLSSMQAKENTDIPETVLQAIMKEIERERIELEKADLQTIKDCLRKLGLTRYYHHGPRILKYINGSTPISIPKDMVDKLCIIFDYIQESFEWARSKHDPGRQAFLNYPYVLYKCCELLEYTEPLKHIRLLKNAEKTRAQDDMWRDMMAMVGWKFIPTI